MNKVLIIGNSGSGKSWLSSRLATQLNLKEVNLDSIVWEPGGFNIQRTADLIEKELQSILKDDSWVVEGVFGKLAEQLICSTDMLLFLDLEWKHCKSSLLLRGCESDKQSNKKLAQDNFQKLLVWASEYNSRDSKSSLKFHNQLFDNFKGEKIRFTDRGQVTKFVNEKNY